MKRILLFLILIIAIQLHGMSQDTLIYRTGEKELVTVLQTDQYAVKYQKWPASTDQLTYNLSSEILEAVYYANGKKVIMENPDFFKPKEEPERMKHFIALDLYDLAFRSLTLSYQFTLKEANNLTIRIPLSTSLSTDKYSNYYSLPYYSRNKVFATGFDIMFFPFSSSNTGFNHGPSSDIGAYKTYSDLPEQKASTDPFWGLHYQVGYFLNTIDHFAMGITLGYGFVNYTWRNQWDLEEKHSITNPSGRLKISIGYTF